MPDEFVELFVFFVFDLVLASSPDGGNFIGDLSVELDWERDKV